MSPTGNKISAYQYEKDAERAEAIEARQERILENLQEELERAALLLTIKRLSFDDKLGGVLARLADIAEEIERVRVTHDPEGRTA